VVQAPFIRRGLLLEYLTLGWNVVGVVIVVAAAYMARSVALAGFGLDSLIEIFASIIVVWQLLGVNQHRERLASSYSINVAGTIRNILCDSFPSSSIRSVTMLDEPVLQEQKSAQALCRLLEVPLHSSLSR
jgi:Zn-dependent protease with chaperone function